eukprot:TRINITY_DN3040_c0_g1_i5.p1 TRINITY_DN3040_c0_g1~~TRINITY_DN3040_c0_g1_i5.p1  ORF type:complete len:108 (+),score=10.47 TRINITY_DN3040_c0_g1_i5:81-404(+)
MSGTSSVGLSSTFANMSSSRIKIISSPSKFTSSPLNSDNKILSPTCTSGGVYFPSKFLIPLPTATTNASLFFFVAESGRRIPPTFVTGLILFTSTRSKSGVRRLVTD